MRVPARTAERGEINEIHVSRDQFSESGFGAVVGVAPQELMIIEHRSSPIIQPRNAKTGQESIGTLLVARRPLRRFPPEPPPHASVHVLGQAHQKSAKLGA